MSLVISINEKFHSGEWNIWGAWGGQVQERAMANLAFLPGHSIVGSGTAIWPVVFSIKHSVQCFLSLIKFPLSSRASAKWVSRSAEHVILAPQASQNMGFLLFKTPSESVKNIHRIISHSYNFVQGHKCTSSQFRAVPYKTPLHPPYQGDKRCSSPDKGRLGGVSQFCE